MNELVVISGKGGTGKTSVLAAFTTLAPNAVIADCDMDAADLHLVLAPTVKHRALFTSGHGAVIRPADCTRCGVCLAHCRFEAVRQEGRGRTAVFTIDPVACEGCGVCVHFCPAKAIDFPERNCGEWFVSETRFGPMVHARLGIAAENSGKLVSTVRREAQRIAVELKCDWILVDGPPGIGCPVIASITGASIILAVTEPTLSGAHDLERVLGLARHFGSPALVCVNKWDLNPAMADTIERQAVTGGARITARIPYDRAVTGAQVAGTTVIEHGDGPAAGAIRQVWADVCGCTAPESGQGRMTA
ncbi:MAG: ATP-binding protein [Planctomycetota bacterium]